MIKYYKKINSIYYLYQCIFLQSE